MRKIITSRLGVQFALTVNLIVLIVAVVTISIFMKNENRRLEEELLTSIKQKSFIGAKMIGTILDEAIDNGVFTVRDVFDTEYEQINEFDPPKYHTRYDSYLDKAVLKLQDEFLKDKNILYAAGVDKSGYLPTHNTRYQQAFTGDAEKDKAGNRTKRLFNDSVGLTAAKNTTPGLQQIYHRDTGEVVWDISSPIYVKDKHWGAFRIGVSTAAVAQARRDLSVTVFWLAALVFISSSILTYIVAHYLLLPLQKINTRIGELAVGRNLKEEIETTCKGEFGELQTLLERLRLSLLKALQRAHKAIGNTGPKMG